MNREEKLSILKTIKTKPEIYKALEKLQIKTGIEIGVREGTNLNNLAKNSVFEKGKLYGLDCWREVPGRPEVNDLGLSQTQLNGQYLQCVRKFANMNHVEIIRDFSVEGSLQFENGYFDFVYIDAAHDYESIMRDLNTWWPKVKDGGIFAGHDYFPDHRVWRGKEVGVYRAVNEFLEERDRSVDHITDMNREGGPGVACTSFFVLK